MKSLKLCSQLFAHLNAKGIRYCHWKSNDHLEEALLGVTDLDLLILPDDRCEFEGSLRDFGLKQMIGQPESTYPGLGDWLGCDEETGELIHLHVHYRVIVGRKFKKEFLLPIDEQVLRATRLVDPIAIPRPEVELLLLVIRANIKLDARTLIKRRRSSGFEIYPRSIRAEFEWLLSETEDAAVLSELDAMGIGIDADMLQHFLLGLRERTLTAGEVRAIRRHLFEVLAPYRWQTRFASQRRYLLAAIMKKKIVRKRLPPRKKRTFDQGAIISLVGADGSGKTTLVGDLEPWLVWKLRVVQCYLGIPKRSRVLRALTAVRKFGRKRGVGAVERGAAALYWIWTALCRRHVCRRARMLADRGYIVLTDRYPLAEFRDMPVPMDGPRIPVACDGHLGWLAAIEARIYRGLGRPDRIYVLRTGLDVLRSRETSLKMDLHRMKADTINGLGDGEGRVIIDGERPYAEVLTDLKRQIWALL